MQEYILLVTRSFSTVLNQAALSLPGERLHSCLVQIFRAAEIVWQWSFALPNRVMLRK